MNYMVLDILDDIGNYVDRLKFYFYLYFGVYKLILVLEGKWIYFGDDMWYVSNMRFRSWVSFSIYYEVYVKVIYNGKYYIVIEVDNGKFFNLS